MSKIKRRRYFIERQFQAKYALLTILFLLIYTLLFSLILFVPYIVPLSLNYPLEEQVSAANMLLSLHKSVWPALGIVILVMGVLSIFITHKIAGPVYRFKKTLNEVVNGNLDVSINLRKRDDLKDLAEHLNTFIREHQVLVHTLQQNQETLSMCISVLENEDERENLERGKVLKEIQQVRKNQENTAAVLKKYTIAD